MKHSVSTKHLVLGLRKSRSIHEFFHVYDLWGAANNVDARRPRRIIAKWYAERWDSKIRENEYELPVFIWISGLREVWRQSMGSSRLKSPSMYLPQRYLEDLW